MAETTPHPMERLDFLLPDFTRVSWTSDEARAFWEPRLERIVRAWADVEWRSIAAGVRRCALTVVPAQEMVPRSAEWARHELNGLPLEIQGLGNFGYSSTAVAPLLGSPFAYRVVIGSPADVAEFKQAFDDANNIGIGRLLGFPDCCQQFFEETWVESALIDTTWQMAARTVSAENGVTTLEVDGPPEANILWRWMAVRAVPHLPCSFDCEATVEFGRKLIQVGRDIGYAEEMDWIMEILSWPAEWDALHGIAEVRTPVLKVSTRTDATSKNYVVRRDGEHYPEEGAQALRFPFRMPEKPLLTGSSHFQRGLENPISFTKPRPPWFASDNGFVSAIAMQMAHKPIVELAGSLLDESPANVLDLGCGNGALLQRLHEDVPATVPFGVEWEEERAQHAGELMPEFADNFAHGDMFESEFPWPEDRRYALAILMPGRLTEVEPEKREKLLEWLADRCDRVLVYAYGDWLTRFGNLRGLTEAAGLKLAAGTPERAEVGLLDGL